MYDHEVSGSSSSHRSCHHFRECVLDCNLFDTSFHGRSYTWRRASLRECLDRVLINNSWALSFQDVGVVYLTKMNSDHYLLWVRAGSFFTLRNPKPFKFITTWLNHDEFGNLVANNWNWNSLWMDNVAHFSQVAATWNHEVFGNILKRKMRLINR